MGERRGDRVRDDGSDRDDATFAGTLHGERVGLGRDLVLAGLEARGELKRIGVPVDPKLEMTEIADRVLRPALVTVSAPK